MIWVYKSFKFKKKTSMRQKKQISSFIKSKICTLVIIIIWNDSGFEGQKCIFKPVKTLMRFQRYYFEVQNIPVTGRMINCTIRINNITKWICITSLMPKVLLKWIMSVSYNLKSIWPRLDDTLITIITLFLCEQVSRTVYFKYRFQLKAQ